MSSIRHWLWGLLGRERSIRTVVYGVQCRLEHESKLVRNLSEFLKTHEAGKLSTLKGETSYNPDDGSPIPPRLDYYYRGSCGKAHPGWFFILEPNVGLNGISKFPDAADCAWLLCVGQRDVFNKTPYYHEVIKDYIAKILLSVEYPTRALHTYRLFVS